MYKNNFFAICFALFAIFFVPSCRRDIGNYTYSPVDTLLISNIDTIVNIKLGGNPAIFPKFASSNSLIDTAEDQFTYRWISYNTTAASTTQQRGILDTTKNLNINIPLGVGTYPVYYQVTQKSTGITWQKRFTLEISGSFGKYGWFVLSQVGDSSQLDYYQDSAGNWNTFPVYYRNVNQYLVDGSTGTSLPLPGKPLSLTSYTSRDFVNTDQGKYYLYINTDQVTQKVNITDGFIWNKAKYLFRNECILTVPPRADLITPYTGYGSMALYNNNIYNYYFAGSIYYNAPLNKIGSSGAVFPVSKFMAVPYSGSNFWTLLYDETNRRFVRYGGGYSIKYCSQLSFPTGVFDPNNLNMDLLWLGWTAAFGGQAVSILKDDSGQYYIARMTFTTTGTFVPLSMTNVTSKLTAIAQATNFAVDQQYGYIFYTSNGKLYEYDMDNDILNTAMDLGGKSVSMLKTERLYNYTVTGTTFLNNPTRWYPVGFSIILGLYDESNPDNSGEVHFLKPGALMTPVTEYFTPFTGMGKVVDVNYLQISSTL